MLGEIVNQFSQRNQWTELNDIRAKQAIPPHYNNLMHVFALSSVKNSYNFSQWYFN